MSAGYTIQRNLVTPMRDGIGLECDVYLPDGKGPFPTLLQRTPYDRADAFGTQYISQLGMLRALDAGFAVVLQDVRGRFGSGGKFDPFVNEADDGRQTVEWIRQQAFSNGQVATFGASYVGATQMLLAMTGTEGHDAMAPFLTSGDYHDQWTYRGGALQLGFVYLWIIEALGPIDVEKRALPADHAVRTTLRELLADPVGAMGQLPVLSEELVALAPYLRDWMGRPAPDDWWSGVSPLSHLQNIRTPALHTAGFNDIFLEGSLAAYRSLRENGATQAVRDGQYLIIGPWSHGNIGDWQGQTWHGYAAAAPAFDLVGKQLDFFTAVLNGQAPQMSRVSYFTSGVNQWRSAEEWPPPARTSSLYLDEAATLSPTVPDAPGRADYVSNTLDPVPTAGGATFLPGLQVNRNDGPQDQVDVEAREDVLVFRSEPLEANLEVTGLVTVELWASSSAVDCDWTARLVDVDQSGRPLGVVDGIVRSRYRNGLHPEPLTPGEAEMFTVELGTTSHVFATGHRIGLQVASSNFPRFDRNPQQMTEPYLATEDDFVKAEQTVLHGPRHPSRLLLPIVS